MGEYFEFLVELEIFYALIGIFSFLVPLIIILIVIRPKKRDLKSKFLSLGQLIGRLYGEIVLVCESPDTTSIMLDPYGNQVRVCEWLEGNTKIVLIFNLNNVCIDIAPTTNIY